MNELEGMIQGLMSNPDEMKKVMEMAGSVMEKLGMSGGGGNGNGNSGGPPPPSGGASGLGNALGALGGLANIAPALEQTAKKLAGGGVKTGMSDKAALFEALRPFLSERRQRKLDRAVQMASVMSMGLGLIGKRGGAK